MFDRVRYRVRCVSAMCGWRGVRTDNPDDCCCYDEWGMYCRPAAPGPGCPRGVQWPCPRCGDKIVTDGRVGEKNDLRR